MRSELQRDKRTKKTKQSNAFPTSFLSLSLDSSLNLYCPLSRPFLYVSARPPLLVTSTPTAPPAAFTFPVFAASATSWFLFSVWVAAIVVDVSIPIQFQSSLSVVLRKPQLDDLVTLYAFHVVNSPTVIVLVNPSKVVVWANTLVPCRTQLPRLGRLVVEASEWFPMVRLSVTTIVLDVFLPIQHHSRGRLVVLHKAQCNPFATCPAFHVNSAPVFIVLITSMFRAHSEAGLCGWLLKPPKDVDGETGGIFLPHFGPMGAFNRGA
jgi:hypothetical protein